MRGMRVTVGTVVGLVASGHSNDYNLEEEEIRQALAYAAWRVEEIEICAPCGGRRSRHYRPDPTPHSIVTHLIQSSFLSLL